MTSVPKQVYVRNRSILIGCRQLACQHCGRKNGTVVAAHSNWHDLGGKGKAIKADDRYVAALCFKCHSDLDQGSKMTKDQRRSMWLAAHTRTIDRLVALNLWPAGVALPQ